MEAVGRLLSAGSAHSKKYGKSGRKIHPKTIKRQVTKFETVEGPKTRETEKVTIWMGLMSVISIIQGGPKVITHTQPFNNSRNSSQDSTKLSENIDMGKA